MKIRFAKVAGWLRGSMSASAWQRLLTLRVALRRMRDSLPRLSSGHLPLLSIVVAAYNTQPYIEETLTSLARQRYRRIEVIVVNDASTDLTGEIAGRFAAKDRRFRLVSAPHGGPGAARNLGAALAGGQYLAFFDSDDIADPLFYFEAIRGLEHSDSDFAVGSYEVLSDGLRRSAPKYVRRVHKENRRGIKLADLPEITVNALCCSKVYRRDFYERCVGPQPEGVFYEDQMTSMRGYVRSGSFDVISRPVLQWRRRPTLDATSQRTVDADNLQHRVNAYRDVSGFLDACDLPLVREQRLLQLLYTDQLTLGHLVEASPQYFDIAAAFLRWAIPLVDAEMYNENVSFGNRVLHWLVMHSDLPTTSSFILSGGRRLASWVFERRDEGSSGLVVGVLPTFDCDRAGIPLAVRCPTERELAKVATVAPPIDG